jgi:hypothetical protein
MLRYSVVYESKRPENKSSWDTSSRSHSQSSSSKKHDSFGQETYESKPDAQTKAFNKNRSEAVVLEIREKYGTITEVEKERLGRVFKLVIS